MRLQRLALVALLSSCVLITGPASALESLDEARCTCADAAVNQGDYVSCMAKFTRRLVLLGAIDEVERSNAIADSSSEDLESLRADCGADAAEGLAVAGWGVGLQVDTPFFPAPAPGDAASVAELSVFLWNLSLSDVVQTTPVSPAGGCGYVVRIFDQLGNRVREDDSICLPVTGRLDLPVGSVEERSFSLPLTALDAETGLVDGTLLPTGGYLIEVTWSANGPSQTDMPSSAGARPSASITVRVGS